ncbi:hypothetical protein MAR_002105 [Mya arenaria]|uniref:B box-type domain-containing protein n=1 Tax=Mya arenaria TaxID=6604 RepID=A0ABY7FFA0_MYAAR|nr:hypothetical protein MAR_002105 [Mya arenaria]
MGHTQHSIENSVSLFTEYLTSRANKYFKRSVRVKRGYFMNHSHTEKKAWFNRECKDKHLKYKEALARLNCNRSPANFENMKRCKKDKYTVRRAKRNHKLLIGKQMHESRRERPREFWKQFKKSRTQADPTISLKDFYEHFKDLADNSENGPDIEIETFLNDFDSNEPDQQNMASKDSSIYMGSDLIHDYSCSKCEENDLNTEALHFCQQCEHYLCGKCVRNHWAYFKEHVVYGRGEIQKWAGFSIDICEQHGKELEVHCDDHQEFCCSVCVALNHRLCSSTSHLSDLAKGFLKTKRFKQLPAALLQTVASQYIGGGREVVVRLSGEFF